MTEIVLIICTSVIFCTIWICKTWVEVELIRSQRHEN